MRLPKQIKVKGVIYKIIRKPCPGLERALGVCDTDAKIIYLRPDLPVKKATHVFMHELFHALFEECGLNATSISSDMEEIIVENSASLILDAFNIEVKKPLQK